MSGNEAIKRIPAAVAGIVQKIEKVAGAAVADLEAKGEETIAKIGRVVEVTKQPLIDADALLDELLGGDNGGPVLDAASEVASTVATFQNTVAGVVGSDIKPGAATAAASVPSKLAKPAVAGVTATDIFKAKNG